MMKGRPRPRSSRSHSHSESTVSLGRVRALAILALSTAGIFISSYLTYVGYRLHRDPTWESVCTINERFDCNAAILSPYAYMAGVPLSVLGAWFYALTALLAAVDLWAPRRAWPRSPGIILLLGSLIASALSVGLAGVSAFVLGSWCLLCLALYLINLCILLVTISAFRATAETVRFAVSAEHARLKRHPLPAAASFLVGSGFLLAVHRIYSEPSSISVACEQAALAARERRVLELVVYSDYQCPHCKTLNASLRQLRQQAGLRITQEHYPLDRACNTHVRMTRYPGACLQALAVLCAVEQGRGLALNDRIFDEGMKDSTHLIGTAASLGLNRELFESCLQSPAVATRLREGIDHAATRDIRGTPTIFLDGRRHLGALSPEDLRCLLSAGDTPSRSTVPR